MIKSSPTDIQSMIERDWQKQAMTKLAAAAPGQVGSPQADKSVMAKAFMDQAYTQVASRCGRLMDDQYRLGFEIVKANEATSKVLGVFAFRVAKELLYVPVFFLNGIIRGADLLHRFTPKRFVANTPDWADYLIDQATTEQGQAVPRSDIGKIRDNVRMDRIVWPPVGPGSFKRASFGGDLGGPTGVNRAGDGQGWYKRESVIKDTIDKCGETWTGERGPRWSMSPQEMEKFAKGALPEEAVIVGADVADGTEKNPTVTRDKMGWAITGKDTDASKAQVWSKSEVEAHIGRKLDSAGDLKKSASSDTPDGLWETWIDDLCVQDREVPLHLTDFMAKSAAAYEGLIGEIERSPALADLLLRNYTQEQLFPEPQFTQEKKASAAPEIVFQIHTEVSTMTGHEKFASADRENFCRHGYFIEDNRPGEKLAKIVERQISESIETAGSNGVYEVMTIDGSYIKAIVGTCIPIPRLENDPGNGLCEPVTVGSYCGDQDHAKTPERNIITWDGSSSVFSTRDLAYGKHVMDAGDPGIEASAMKSGKVYCLVSPAGEITPAFKVQDVKTGKDKIRTFKIATSPWSNQSLVLNPDASQTVCDGAGVINDKYRAIELEHKTPKDDPYSRCSGEGDQWTLENLILGNESSVDAWLLGKAPIKKASVNYDSRADMYQLRLERGGKVLTAHEAASMHQKVAMQSEQGRYDLAHDDTTTGWISRVKMAAQLTVNLALSGEEADLWLDEATEKRAADRSLLYPEPPMEKTATMMRMINNPAYQLDSDSQLGVPVEYGPQLHTLQTGYSVVPPMPMQINEVVDGARGVSNQDKDDYLFHADPYKIAEMAASSRMPHVLDHAMIGTLASTYDAAAAMDPILADMERGLDALGRAVFLLLWKPTDFRAMYGADDIPNIENQLLSVFKSMAATLLDLLRKNRGNKNTTGSPPVG